MASFRKNSLHNVGAPQKEILLLLTSASPSATPGEMHLALIIVFFISQTTYPLLQLSHNSP